MRPTLAQTGSHGTLRHYIHRRADRHRFLKAMDCPSLLLSLVVDQHRAIAHPTTHHTQADQTPITPMDHRALAILIDEGRIALQARQLA